MPQVTVSPYAGNDFYEVVELLARSLTADSVNPALFSRKVLLDPNFDPHGALVARLDDHIAGFLLAISRRKPLEDGPDDSGRGWITLFAVDAGSRRQGLGSRMLAQALDYLRSRGVKTVSVSPYAPNYWTPGVDEAAYPGAVAFLEKRGFRKVSRPISMDARLVGGWSVPEWARRREAALNEEAVTIDTFDPAHIPALNWFLREHFAGDWQRYIRETMTDISLGRRFADDLIVCWDSNPASENAAPRLLGFSQHEGERFGPFGVAKSERGRGIGAVLLFRTLEIMRRKGHHNAWFMWTDDATADRVYRSAGFKETRRYAVMSRDL